jgi:hypothetical protein
LIVTAAGVIQDAAANELGYRDIPPITFGANYTVSLSDRGKGVLPTTTGLTVTLPSGVMPGGSVVTIFANQACVIHPAPGLTMYWAGVGGSGDRNLALSGVATIWYLNSTFSVLSGSGLS